jgi:hypothetical protein
MPLRMRGSVSARFKRVILFPNCSRKLFVSGVEYFQTTGIQIIESGFALDQVQRRTLLCPGFRQSQLPVLNSNTADIATFSSLAALVVPVQPAGNHQVQHEPQISFEAEADPFTKSAQLDDFLPSTLDRGGTAVRNKKGLAIRTRSRSTALNSFLESLDINNDVRQFRH